LTPPTPLTALYRAPERLRSYPHDAVRALPLWRQAGGASRPLRLATMDAWEGVAHTLAAQLHRTLSLQVEVSVVRGDEQREARRRLAAKEPRDWDVLLLEQGSQSADVPPLELHRAFVGRSGEFRAGPVDARFEQLFADLVGQTSQVKQVLASNRIDRYVTEQASRCSSSRRRCCTRSTATSTLCRTPRASSGPRPPCARGTGPCRAESHSDSASCTHDRRRAVTGLSWVVGSHLARPYDPTLCGCPGGTTSRGATA
ncbi:MAG: hypothetical protein M3O86_04285, partial [Actinomycetota bacterium]|nr:hypothetical protein [Actinomycetota bacterium]